MVCSCPPPRSEVRPLDAVALAGDPLSGARRLLGALLERTEDLPLRARIVEVEAYGPDDPASHSYRGRTARCASMFAAPGTAYVYRSYGVHWCLNVVVGRTGQGAAVLLRAAELLEGHDEVAARRPGVPDHALLRGPGCLTRGLAIDGDLDGTDLTGTGPWRLWDDGFRAPVQTGPRVGISAAPDVPWRLRVEGSPAVSRYRRSPRAASA